MFISTSRYLLFIVLTFISINGFSQSKIPAQNITPYFSNLNSNFKWNNFSFRYPYDNYVLDIEEISRLILI